MMKKALSVASLLTLALSVDAQAVDISIVSDNTDAWSVSETHFDSMGQLVTKELGKPQYVCLNATTIPAVPSNCPTMAMSYGYEFMGWTADLSSLPPNAKWIWASKKSDGMPITGATTGAANAGYSFKTKFYLCGNHPQDGTIWVAADNSVEVFLNGAPVSVLSWNSHSAVGSVSIPATSLKTSPNPNVIELKVKNGNNPADCASDQYQCNPAGVTFGGKFSNELSANPICTNPIGKVGDVKDLGSCASPQTGSKYSACVCLGGAAGWFDYDTCKTQPPTCTGYTFSAWSACGTDGQQTRTVTGNTPVGCIGTPSTQPVLTQVCTYVPPTCTSFTYSAWGECQPDNTQTRTVLASSPAGCTGGVPVTTQSCTYTYVPPLVGAGDECGAIDHIPPIFATCPSGTTCKSRRSGGHKPAWWCIFTLGIGPDCGSSPPLETVDWYCDPE